MGGRVKHLQVNRFATSRKVHLANILPLGSPRPPLALTETLVLSAFLIDQETANPALTSAYDYGLPEELVAATPSSTRIGSRLMHVDPLNHSFTHHAFKDILSIIEPGDRLVFNNTKVLPSRIYARKETGGKVELMVLERRDTSAWDMPSTGTIALWCMTRSSKALKPGSTLRVEGSELELQLITVEPGRALVEVSWEGSALELLEHTGKLPLPPYIVQRRKTLGQASFEESDKERYQTVYAKHAGAVAAPTAGLHFSRQLLDELEDRGVARSEVTLHVGMGTFKPVDANALADHPMHSETYVVPEELARDLAATKQAGGRVIAVGTTTARVLEAEARRAAPFTPGERDTTIMLHPGNRFRYCDGLITNYHLPRSTLLALVSAMTGYELMRAIYDEAIRERYRFYSYGDSMIILPPRTQG